MFSKKKPEGTEDQAYDLMNLGGFGGLQRKSSPGTTEPSPNGKPFENAIKQSGRTVEQVIKEQEEDISPDFYQKDPNTFSLVANYFYEVLIKVKSNLKQGKEFEVDLDGNIPMNMLKSSTAFSKDTATSYITSTFALVAAIFISLDTRDIKDEERFSLLQLTKGVFGAIENFCNKEFGTETKQQTSEKNGEDKKDLKQLSEALQNNPNIPDDLKKGLKDIASLFSGETPLAEIQFKNAIESLTDDQTKGKYLETIEGNIFTATFSSDYFKEYYPNVNALKAELKNVDKYIEFYAYGIYANAYSEDREFALTKFSTKLAEADNSEIAAMVFGVACSAIVQNRAGKESIHAQIFTIASQYLAHQEKSKAETKASFAQGFKERGIEVSDSTLNMVSQFAEDYAKQTVQTEEDKNRLKQDFEPIAQKYKHLDSKESDKVLVAFEQLIDIMKSEFTEVEEHKEFIAFIERQKTNPNVLKVVELVLQSYAKLGALDENGIREFLKIKDQVAHFIQSNKDLEQRKIMETVLFPIATVTAISMVHGLVEQMGLSEEHKLKLRDRFQELTEEYREIAEHEDEPNSEILKELQQLIAENPDQDPMELLVKHIGSKFDNTR